MQKSASRRGCHISETLSLFLTFNKLLCALVPFWPYFYQSQHPDRFVSPPTNHSVPKLPSNSWALSYSIPHPLTIQISAPCLLSGDGASLEVNWWIIASRWNIMDPRPVQLVALENCSLSQTLAGGGRSAEHPGRPLTLPGFPKLPVTKSNVCQMKRRRCGRSVTPGRLRTETSFPLGCAWRSRGTAISNVRTQRLFPDILVFYLSPHLDSKRRQSRYFMMVKGSISHYYV